MIRPDFEVIISFIRRGARVLDLGCGGGELLEVLKAEKDVSGVGIEIDEEEICKCVQRGITVSHGNIEEELSEYPENSFDYVILSQTLQQVLRPGQLMDEMLRVGKKAIISFPNLGYYPNRWQIFAGGITPKTSNLPYEWFDTPNFHFLTIKDFFRFAAKKGFKIERKVFMKKGRKISFMPNIFAELGIFKVGK